MFRDLITDYIYRYLLILDTNITIVTAAVVTTNNNITIFQLY